MAEAKDMDAMFGSDSEGEEETSSSPVLSNSTTTVDKKKTCATVKTMSQVGGGRGVFAEADLPAGCLIVLEWPALTWGDLDLSNAEDMTTLLLRILQDPVAWKVSKTLHPISLDGLDAQEVQDAFDSVEAAQLTQILSQVPQATKDEVIRIYLTLKHNGFGSGLYQDLCMINHSCDPNCIKFEPRAGSRGSSEVWTIRPVRAGEELTISYCSPLESISNTVRSYLESQHKFQCSCSRCKVYLKWLEYTEHLEHEHDEDCSKHDSEHAHLRTLEVLQDYEDQVEDWEFQLSSLQYDRKDVHILERMMTDIEAEVSKFETMRDAINEDDWLRTIARSKLLITSVCMKALALLENSKSKLVGPIAQKLVSNNMSLLSLQQQYLGPDHSDIATTIFDIINALELAQSVMPNKEFEEFLQALPWEEWFQATLKQTRVFITASNIMKTLKIEGNRIKDLYMIVKRSPSAVYCQKLPGQSFWGIL